jgi:hypothetical protein
MHVATTRRHYNDKVYETHLLRRSYREGAKVKSETLANLSHLPPKALEALRRILRGESLVSATDALRIERSLPHGHVACVLGTLRKLDLERLLSRERSRERDLCVALICQRLLAPGSKLDASRRFSQSTLAQELCLGEEVKEAELLKAMDWLLARQERIERGLARRHLQEGSFVLYDLSSSYLEGRECPLAARGYSRDGKRSKLQISYGLICSHEGHPVGVEVHEGNVGESSTLEGAVERVTKRFGIQRVVFVGDRGMITEARCEELKRRGLMFITALRAPQIQALREEGALQLSLFDERDLAEISSEEFPGERLVVCRNPAVASERARKREELLGLTEAELAKVKRMVDSARGRLRGKKAGMIGERVGRVSNKYKMAKHFELEIADGHFNYRRKHDEIEREAALDGIYVLRTTTEQRDFGAPAVIRAYKQLKVAERAFRHMKSDELEIRPIHHRLAERVRAHVFLCMLAYYVQFELRARLAELLFVEEAPVSPADPVAPAERSPGARRKAGAKRTEDGLHPVHSFKSLLAEMGTLCRNRVRIESTGDESYEQLTEPTPLQARALELLGLKLGSKAL